MAIVAACAGGLTSEQYPSGRVLTTSYDSANRLYATSGTLAGVPKNYNTQTNYWPSGAVTNYWYGNNVVPVYTYNSRLQLSHSWVTIGNSSNSYLQALNDDWGTANNNGNLQSGSQGYGAAVPFSSLSYLNQSYVYDGVNRLRSVADTGYSRSFCSDPWGNTW